MNSVLKELFNSTLGRSSVVKDLISAGQEDGSIIYIDPSQHVTPDGQEGWSFQGIGGEFHYFKYKDYASCVKAYDKCPPVSAIINRKAQAFINGKTWVLNSVGKEAQGTQAKKMRAILAEPNPLQSWSQFEAQGYIFQQLFGFNIILPIKPFGFTDPLDTSSMWNIPANWIDVRATQERFTRAGVTALEDIVVSYGGNRTILKLADLIIIKDFTPSFSTLTFPGSKIMALEMPINNIIGAFESRNVLINYRGALGILTSDPGKGQFAALPMSDPEKLALERDFRRYGLRAKQFQVIMTTASLKWQSMGYPTKDLMLMEEVEESTVAICANLNFPPFILGLRDTTYNNMEEASKGLYQNAIIPDANSIYEQLSKYFRLSEYNLRLDKDYSHVEALQKDKVQQATARKTLDEACKLEFEMGLITLNDWLLEIGKDPIGDLGNVRATDPRNNNAPMAVSLGVGGTASLIQVVTATGLSAEARQAILEILFGLSPADAQRMSQNSNDGQQQQEQGQQGQTTGQSQQAAA
jgi:hypothetical protein